MKNKLFFFTLLVLLFFNQLISADEFKVTSFNIKIDKNSKIAILEGDVVATDYKNNKLFTDKAKYNKKEKQLITVGNTKIVTSEGFQVIGENVFFDDKKKIITSNENTKIIDKNGNQIFVESFNYLIEKNIFFSKGNIKIIDINNNNYNFSEIYIDEKKRKIAGSDVKVFLNNDSFKVNKKNEPRFFANSITMDKNNNELLKGVFTYCKNRGENKCPPWTLQSEKINHNTAKKTIYYDNAIIKVYDFPIFYFPKFSHPDPTVKRRSGFLVPSFTDNSTLGAGITLPYFWAMSDDKDLTFKPKLYGRENPLLLTEYRQDFKNSFLIVDTGFTKGYKKTTHKKTSGSRAHFFSKFNMSFLQEENQNSDLEINLQKVSNATYLKIHDIETELVDNDLNILENDLSYSYENENMFFGAKISSFEDLTVKDNSRYEYLLPYLTLDKNILASEQYGFFDLSSNLQVRNYDVNKKTEFFVNDINWKSNKQINSLGIESHFESLIKSVNYNSKNTNVYKPEDDSLLGAFGFLAKIPFYKNDLNKGFNHLFTPKILLRYAPGHMRRTTEGRLKYSNLYEIKKTTEIDIIERGLSASLGFDYTKNILEKDGNIGSKTFSFSAGQVISAEEDRDLPSRSTLNEKLSDIVGESSLKLNDKLSLDYKFAIDQSYKELNYNEIGTDITFGSAKFNLGYLEEKNHIGSTEYVKTGIDIELNSSTQLSFSTKRNLLTSSADFYKLSYDYINDCLKAGLVFRREFYTDSDIEPEDSLMFRISLIPFANITSPSFGR